MGDAGDGGAAAVEDDHSLVAESDVEQSDGAGGGVNLVDTVPGDIAAGAMEPAGFGLDGVGAVGNAEGDPAVDGVSFRALAADGCPEYAELGHIPVDVPVIERPPIAAGAAVNRGVGAFFVGLVVG